MSLSQTQSDTPSHIIEFDPQIATNLKSTWLNCDISDPYSDLEAFILRANLCFADFPAAIRSKLYEFRRYGNSKGFLLVKNLPSDDNLPSIPLKVSIQNHKRTYFSEFWLAALSTSLGEIYAFSQEQNGAVFQNIYPTPAGAILQRSDSSDVLLEFHTEIAFDPYRPDYVLLYCVRPDPSNTAKTLIAHVQDLLSSIPTDLKSTLFQELFISGVDSSFNSNKSSFVLDNHRFPILYGSRDDPYMCLDIDLMSGLTEKANEALVYLSRVAVECAHTIEISQGDLLIIDNKRSIHARTPFTPRYDGSDRWLQRVFVREQLPSCIRVAKSRVYSTNY